MEGLAPVATWVSRSRQTEGMGNNILTQDGQLDQIVIQLGTYRY